jgi:hypothetical protein
MPIVRRAPPNTLQQPPEKVVPPQVPTQIVVDNTAMLKGLSELSAQNRRAVELLADKLIESKRQFVAVVERDKEGRIYKINLSEI